MLRALAAACFALAAAAGADELRLATTTSVENSGLLQKLLPDFEAECACAVRVIPVGTGKALALARRGDVDALITHAPADEERFIAEGYGAERRAVMQNYFVLLGPEEDAANVRTQPDISAALSRIAETGAKFVSRGDNSGTHKKELSLWRQSGITPRGEWYLSAGVGMGQALIVADELGAYVLSDYGTYLYFRGRVALAVLSQNTPPLKNPYSVMRVSAARHPHVNEALAARFIGWITGEKTQRAIAAYRINGEALFTPAARF